MDVPTATQIKAWSDVPAVTSAGDEWLQVRVDRAVQYIEQVTGRIPLTTVPEQLATVAAEAVQYRTEQLVLSGRAAAVSAQVNPGGVTSYSVPGYSETRRDPSKSVPRGDVLNPWPALADLLWLLMTEERRASWRAAMGAGDEDPAIELVPLGLPEEIE